MRIPWTRNEDGDIGCLHNCDGKTSWETTIWRRRKKGRRKMRRKRSKKRSRNRAQMHLET
jgi:hypothetical protein